MLPNFSLVLSLVSYVLVGMVGGLTYTLITKIWSERAELIRRLALGAIAGFLSFLILTAANMDLSNVALAALSYLSTWASGYVAIDFIEAVLDRFQPRETHSGIPF
jgi:uncharacterized membrane protein